MVRLSHPSLISLVSVRSSLLLITKCVVVLFTCSATNKLLGLLDLLRHVSYIRFQQTNRYVTSRSNSHFVRFVINKRASNQATNVNISVIKLTISTTSRVDLRQTNVSQISTDRDKQYRRKRADENRLFEQLLSDLEIEYKTIIKPYSI